jgi:uncharacterized protein YqjF (DUF2071 family)
MAQNWHDLLFAHWPVEKTLLRSLLPTSLEIDVFEGQAWISVVPFAMSGVRLRGTLALTWLSSFPELNVRTYVTGGGKPGVWFFSLDAANALAVKIARSWFHLPYFHAVMNIEREQARTAITEIHYGSRRKGTVRAEFNAAYAPEGPGFLARPGTPEYFLAERYCLYAQRPDGAILRGEIHHAPWELQQVSARISANTMAAHLGLDLSRPPVLAHFARLQEVVVWQPEMLRR